MYINNEDNSEQKQWHEINAINPAQSIPPSGTEIIAEIWYLIHPDPRPTYDVYTERLELVQPVFKDPIYTQGWAIVPLTVEQIQAHIDNAQTGKIRELWQYADTLKQTSESAILSGGGDISTRITKENSRIANIKIAGGVTTPEEDQFFNDYNDSLQYQSEVDTVAIEEEAIINAMTDAQAIYDYDVANTPAWPAIT